MVVVGDLNGWFGNRVRGVTRTFGVDGGNGERIVQFCAEGGMCVTNTFFQNRAINKYTWRSLRDNVEPNCMIDSILVKGDR